MLRETVFGEIAMHTDATLGQQVDDDGGDFRNRIDLNPHPPNARIPPKPSLLPHRELARAQNRRRHGLLQ
jgi:hypothetical protein